MKRFLIVFVIALAACQTPDTAENVSEIPIRTVSDTDSDRAAIQASTAAYQAALRAGDPVAIAALHADDAIIHPANSPSVRGRADLEAYFVSTDSAPEDITLSTEAITLSEAGDIAYEVGTTSGPGWTGKYLTVYRRTTSGWRIVADSWSRDAPPTTE